MPLSHPLRVRGLKLYVGKEWRNRGWSHPLRVRGLKHSIQGGAYGNKKVASFTGAWIETSCLSYSWAAFTVASFTGAWIETTV